ncbi:MAG: endo-1,4-beta-xylanase [Verrucomicrobia bacterium]|nr:endo-1,4-beta-xylanase [Verrucomicrobiota bacterium]
MDPRHVSRRRFLWQSSALTALAATPLNGLSQTAEDALGAEDAKPPTTTDKNTQYVRVLLREADGAPLEKERVTTLHARDLPNDPLPQTIIGAEGRVRIALAQEALQVSARLKVPGFGEVYCYADNGGKGFTQVKNVEFVVDAAETRLRRVREAALELKGLRITDDAVFQKHLEQASRPIPTTTGAAQTAAAYEALSHGLHAGEQLTMLAAQQRIAKFSVPRKDFLFGCLGSGWQRGGEWEKRFVEAFNFATVSWYTWKNEQPQSERIDYWRQDQSLQWALDRKIVPKGFGYVYMSNGAMAEWFRTWTWDRVLPEYKRIVEETTRRYHGRMPYVEVINEAHDKANIFRFSQTQVLELTREACDAARRGSATIKRQINHCCMWAEYAKRPNTDGTRRWSPFRYLTDCVKSGVEFETIGLQLYYPQHDLFEIERMLHRFTAFKRPIHITEISCNSAEGLDPASMRPNSLVPPWHGPWTETLQADWMEAIYTLCYSKPEFQAIGWWDLSDSGGHFWPHGGLLRGDFTPKESYHRLLKLQKQWGVSK